MKVIFWGLIFICLSSATFAADQEKTILDSDWDNSSGVDIVAGNWNKTIHADKIYREWETTIKDVHKKALGKYDYYYSLEIVPQFKNVTTCPDDQNQGWAFWRALLGEERGALVIVKANIQHRWGIGYPVDLLKGDAVLALMATGGSSSSPKTGRGCFFDATARPTFPIILYAGGRNNTTYDDFTIKFIVMGGSTAESNAVGNVVALANGVSAASRWTALTTVLGSAVFDGFSKLASAFESALVQANTIQHYFAVSHTLKASGSDSNFEGRLAITLPDFFDTNGSGNLVIYIKRWGSLALAVADIKEIQPKSQQQTEKKKKLTGKNTSPALTESKATEVTNEPITTDIVFDSVLLANRGCSLNVAVAGDCKNTDSFRTTLAKLVKPVLDRDDATLGKYSLGVDRPDAPLIDLNSKASYSRLYDVCKAISTVAKLNLHLNSLDTLLIRWAVMKNSGVIDIFNNSDPTKLASLLSEQEAFSSGRLNLPPDLRLGKLQEVCWSETDKKLLDGLAKKIARSWSE